MAFELRKERFGVFASFVEEGTVVGENTVGIDFFPDATENPEAWNSLGSVQQSNLEPETEESDPDYDPVPEGGYEKSVDSYVTRDIYKASLKCHFEIIHRLIWGAAAKLANGTPVSPFVKKDRFVRGWINIQLRAEDGTDRMVAALWGKMRLDANPVWSKDASKPAIRFEVVRSPIAAIEPEAVVAP